MVERFVVRFLRRGGALPTWVYERRALIALEFTCLLALLWTTPTRVAFWVALAAGLIGVDASLCAQAARSASARKAAAARRELRGVDVHAQPAWYRLRCEREIEHASARGQVLAVATPIAAMIGAATVSGGIPRAAMVGSLVVIARFSWAFVAYPAWRAWWEMRR